MDFEYRYTPQQEAFREEVRGWLVANIPSDLNRPPDEGHTDRQTFLQLRELRRKLGEKGWLFPTWPKEYGGGGLSPDHDAVIKEEIEAAGIPTHVHAYMDPSTPLLAGIVGVWGTEEQKERFVRPVLAGRMTAFQLSTEPSAGSDLAGVKTRAVRDGDDWLITGEKVFNGSRHGYLLSPPADIDMSEEVDEMFALASTDPEAPRHRNLGLFVIPGNAQGVTFHTLDLLARTGKQQIYMDNVRVPADRLIGAPGQGWQVANTGLELEHGATGQLIARDQVVQQLIALARETGAGRDPHLQQLVVDAYVDSQIRRLFGLRNYWMYESRQEMTYQGSQNTLWGKESSIRIADAVRDVLGLTALLDHKDLEAPFAGELEGHQRGSLIGAHPGGTIEVHKVIMARRLGVSRTRERAAVTPATMNKQANVS